MAIKTGQELAAAAEAVAKKHKTLYVMGCFGAPMNAGTKSRWINHHTYNQKPERKAKIKAASDLTFGFDCVCFIKALLWGWRGDAGHQYGGAAYTSNGVPDINADQMIDRCAGVSTNFSAMQVGEVVWMPGHIGVYIGSGLAVECSPKWADGVQITAVLNIGGKAGYNGRKWTKHGRLPWVTYETAPATKPAEKSTTGATLCTVKLPVLKKGAKGEPVKALQALLIGYGYTCGSSGVDGSFGPATNKALRAYQKARGLAVDGSCGPATWSSLLGV